LSRSEIGSIPWTIRFVMPGPEAIGGFASISPEMPRKRLARPNCFAAYHTNTPVPAIRSKTHRQEAMRRDFLKPASGLFQEIMSP
jgi:hypothetical protein